MSATFTAPSVDANVAELSAARAALMDHIMGLQDQLAAADVERYRLDMRLAAASFAASFDADPDCARVRDAFDAARQQFDASLEAPADWDAEVPYRSSDDFADTAYFDDWVDAQLEVFRARQSEEDYEGALRVLLLTSDLLQRMIHVVGDIDGADSGILLECRDHVVEHWRQVSQGRRQDAQLEAVVEAVGAQVREYLDRIGEPFTSALDNE